MNKNKSITPLPPASFIPTQNEYNDLQPFRHWCQKVLPLVYDDSLSYYELLCKVVDYLNKAMEDINALHGDINNLYNSYKLLQEYVNDYFSSLDVQEEINNKLDELVESGRLDILFKNYIPFKTPEMFGAKGDGVANDTEALKACFNNEGLIICRGTYYVTDKLTLKANTIIEGCETGSIRSNKNNIITCNGNHIVIRNIFIAPKSEYIKSQVNNIVEINKKSYIILDNVEIGGNEDTTGIKVTNGSYYITVRNCYFGACKLACEFSETVNAFTLTDTSFYNNKQDVVISHCNGWRIMNNTFQDTDGMCITVGNGDNYTTGCIISGNYFEPKDATHKFAIDNVDSRGVVYLGNKYSTIDMLKNPIGTSIMLDSNDATLKFTQHINRLGLTPILPSYVNTYAYSNSLLLTRTKDNKHPQLFIGCGSDPKQLLFTIEEGHKAILPVNIYNDDGTVKEEIRTLNGFTVLQYDDDYLKLGKRETETPNALYFKNNKIHYRDDQGVDHVIATEQ